jgi:hypothetical protein
MSCQLYDWKQQIQQCLEAVPIYLTAYFTALCSGHWWLQLIFVLVMNSLYCDPWLQLSVLALFHTCIICLPTQYIWSVEMLDLVSRYNNFCEKRHISLDLLKQVHQLVSDMLSDVVSTRAGRRHVGILGRPLMWCSGQANHLEPLQTIILWTFLGLEQAGEHLWRCICKWQIILGEILLCVENLSLPALYFWLFQRCFTIPYKFAHWAAVWLAWPW